MSQRDIRFVQYEIYFQLRGVHHIQNNFDFTVQLYLNTNSVKHLIDQLNLTKSFTCTN